MASSATKQKNGKWRCKAYYTDDAGKYTSKSFTAETKKEAEYLARSFIMERKHAAKPENITLGQLADRFIESRSNLLSPSTIVGYKKIRKTALQDIIDYRIGLLTKHLYQKAINDYSVNRSYKTVLSAHSFFRKVLKENGINIAENIDLPPKEKKQIKVPTVDEVKLLLQYTKGTRLHLYCLFAVILGMRKSEIIAVQWKDIDIDKQTISINKARVKNTDKEYVLKQTKTFDSTRTLHLPSVIIEELGEVGEPEEFIIQDTPDALDSQYKRLQKKMNFPYNFHSLRHFYASVMLMSGIPNKYAIDRMGHATENMLQRVYQHTFESKQQEYDVILDNFFAETLTPKAE